MQADQADHLWPIIKFYLICLGLKLIINFYAQI